MKLFSISSSLNSRAYSLHHKIQTQLFRTTPTRTRTRTRFSSLYNRVSPLGDPNLSIVPALDQWIGEGKSVSKLELLGVINELMKFRRFKHALEASLWMTNKRHFRVAPFDISLRLKLIFKLFGLEESENYFNKIPESLKTHHVYLTLLNCYCIAKSMDKAEAIMQKARDLGYASKPIWYNLVMNLHYKLGNREKLGELLTEMEAKGISYDHFTFSVCLNACSVASDAVGMDKIVNIMESDRTGIVGWRTCVVGAEGYLRMGLIDYALVMLNKLEAQLKTSQENDVLFAFLLKLYAEAGRKDELYRIWNMYKQKRKVVNKVYASMMRSLMRFGDIEGMERIFEDWESRVWLYDFRIPNFLIDDYCTYGHLEKAEALVAKGILKGGEPLVTTWCHLAGGYLKKNQLPEAVEALKKAISVFPPKFMARKDCLTTCLEYLEKGDCMEKAEELINLVRIRGISREADSGDLLGKDGGVQFCVEN